MEGQVPCPRCKTLNRAGAKFCVSCGEMLPVSGVSVKSGGLPSASQAASTASISPTTSPIRPKTNPPETSASVSGSKPTTDSSSPQNLNDIGMAINRKLDTIDDNVDNWLIRFYHKIVGDNRPGRSQSTSTRNENLTSPVSPNTVKAIHPITPMIVYAMIGHYRVLQVKPLARSNYYLVQPTECINGHINQTVSDQKCVTCQAPLLPLIMHETPAIRQIKIQEIFKLSSGLPAALPFDSIFVQKDRKYTLVKMPAGLWQPLSMVKPSPEQALNWTIQLGGALEELNKRSSLFFDEQSILDLFDPIVVVNQQNAYFADISSCIMNVRDTQIDVMYLASILYRLSTGDNQRLSRVNNLDHVPTQIRGYLQKARSGAYGSVAAFIADLQLPNFVPDTTRSLRQNAGYRTDKGTVRDHNEDQVGKYSLGMDQTADTVEVGLYLVADGMGGHQAGEQASKEVAKIILDHIHKNLSGLQNVPKLQRQTINLDKLITPGEVLKMAIQQGNELLYKTRMAVSSDRGTTITAALVVGDQCTIANVGDSRTYLSHEGQLRQITKDHSLVAQLVAAGMIKPEEVRTHPNRNQIYRTFRR